MSRGECNANKPFAEVGNEDVAEGGDLTTYKWVTEASSYMCFTEIESLRRHLALAVGELKNPIVLPKAESEDGSDSGVGEDDDDTFSVSGEGGGFEHEAWQADVDELLKDLVLFKRKVADDKDRFPHPAMSEVDIGAG